ncbi:MAG TPA: hypothetical protein VHU92_03890 [Streptosporangiaceae bacterium]|nr:hypothetical protein [Streptosporangiaceae bacterium]
MWSLTSPRLRRSLTVLTLAGLLASAGGIASAASASASASKAGKASKSLTVKYKVTGATLIKSVDATAPLGPGKLTATVNLTTAALTANLSLPAATISFKEFGIVPVTATVNLVQDGQTTGQLNTSTGAVKTKSKITLQLTALFISGLAIPVPATCQSATPAVVKLVSQKGFSVVKGGNLAGTYTIPPVANCGELTALLNVIFPGPGNTINLKLGAAKVVS